MRFGKTFYIIVILICVFEVVRIWNITPQQMAAHFNVQGNPDHFVSKAEFFGFQLQTMLIVVGTSLVPQLLLFILPVSFINMPNRDYWLSPERRDSTVDRLSSFAAAMFGIILLVIQVGFEISAYANLQMPILFNAKLMLMVMIASFVLIGGMLLQLTVSFRLPATKED